MAPEVKKLSGFVGFANLPNQVHRRSIKKGFQFTVLVVGESGLGKATVINSLFNAPIFPKKKNATLPTSVQIQNYSCDIEEKGVRLKLNVLEAQGFGDLLDNSQSWKPIVECVEERYDAYLDQERRVNRRNIQDNRIHACLYFISPTGHSLKPIDIEFMKNLHEKVNIIPVIAKADTLTDEEKAAFKKRILDDLDFHGINIYRIDVDADDDEETKTKSRELKAATPFAVVGPDGEIEVAQKKIKGRKFPWGIIDVENENHCDFVKLRDLLIKTHTEELRCRTNEVLYEQYRAAKLMGGDSGSKKGDNPITAFEEEKKQHEQKMKKMEKEMKQVFDQKVKEKESRLKESEAKMNADHKETKDQLEKQIKELERQLEEAQKPEKKKKKSGLF